ncbi:hypothetical protein VaNZ11_015334 [Volvox africanus]|uniref:START domain-containing protein n=1 Tax=Volvox africanus TaxID=51714 RepID=A0ABQ5SKB4_9CHLO|nr:hypothetical protein VaNZ11_015334 [Volvox africanus]
MAAEYPPRDRLSLRAYIRARMRDRGLLEFADDDEVARSRSEMVYMNCGQSWCEGALSRTELELEALLATTTDCPMQSIGNTVLDNGEFWSSTGTSTCKADEALLYRLRQPLSSIAYVSVAVYRAFYQHGDPLYPPRKVSFLTGPSPNQLYPASPIYPVRLTDDAQVFALSPTAAVSQYLMVRMHGRRQRQWEDLQFYIAIRHVAAYGDLVDVSSSIQMMRLARSRGLAWPCTRGLMSAMATLGTVWEHPQEQGAPGGARGRTRPGDAEGACLWPLPLRRRSSTGAMPDQALSEDVFTAGPKLSSEARRVYVSVAMRRGPALPSLALEPDIPVRTGGLRGPAHCPVLPSGPTYSELSLAVQHSGVLRALPHLVKIPWPEILSVTTRRRMRQQHLHEKEQKQQLPVLAVKVDNPNRRSPSLRRHSDFEEGLYGRLPTRRHGEDALHYLNRERSGISGATRGIARLAGNAARRGIGSLQRLHEWVVAAAKGTSAAVANDDTDPATNMGRGEAGAQRAEELPGDVRGRFFSSMNTAGGGSHNGAQLLGTISTGRDLSSSDPRRLQHPDDEDQQEDVDVAPEWLWEVFTGSDSDEPFATEMPATSGPSGDTRVGAMARSAADASGNTAEREAAELRALVSGQNSHLGLLTNNSMITNARDSNLQLMVQSIQAYGDADETDGAAAAFTSGGCNALRHARPQQPLPPPKLRRRGDDGHEGSSAPGKVAVDGGDGGEAQLRRRQRHLRAARRAMQPALYRPYKDTALFIALDVWAGARMYSSCGSSSARRQAAAAAAGGGGDGAGCWLVSHYDHEHL